MLMPITKKSLQRLRKSLLICALVAMFVGAGPTAEAKADWFVRGVVRGSRYEARTTPRLPSAGTVVGGVIRGGSSDNYPSGHADFSLSFGRSLLRVGYFSFSLASGFERSRDLAFNAIPLNVEVRYNTPFRIAKFAPFMFVESGVFYAYSQLPNASEREDDFLDDFAIDRNPGSDNANSREGAFGTEFGLGLGVVKSLSSSLSIESSLSGRLQYVPRIFIVDRQDNRDFPGLILPLGNSPKSITYRGGVESTTFFSFNLGLRF